MARVKMGRKRVTVKGPTRQAGRHPKRGLLVPSWSLWLPALPSFFPLFLVLLTVLQRSPDHAVVL